MFKDRYGNKLATSSRDACDAYVRGVDCFLAADVDAEEAFLEALRHDQRFALAHAGLARNRQTLGRKGALEAIATAESLTTGLSERERQHVHCLGLLIRGNSAGAFDAMTRHLVDYPRDVLIAQPGTGVFGLIGFSGRAGREAEHLAFTSSLARAYGDDWWFLTQHAFAQTECGQTEAAAVNMERALAGNPRNANAAHYRAHLDYETGEAEAGYEFLKKWMKDYDRDALLHCHNSWHIALWAMALQRTDEMWSVLDDAVAPGSAWGPPINVVTDTVAFLFRAELSGIAVEQSRWNRISEYSLKHYPDPGLVFVDVHAALAHARAGNTKALNNIIENPQGTAGDVVENLARAFDAYTQGKLSVAEDFLLEGMIDHARIGGSCAQRDLLEFLMSDIIKKQGRTKDARNLLAMRRPVSARACGMI